VKAKWNVGLPVILMIVFALSRWPGLMPENFSAAYGLAFCAGVFFPRRLAWWLPLSVLLVTDIGCNYYYSVSAPKNIQITLSDMVLYLLPNYAVYAALIWFGKRFSSKSSWISLVAGGLLGAILFYLVSNTGAWLQNPEYARTLAGWIQALTVGTPGWPHTWEFFRNTLMSGGLFTGLFAGAMKLAAAMEPEEEKEEKAPESEEGEPEESPA
jgi:hypothetical protein